MWGVSGSKVFSVTTPNSAHTAIQIPKHMQTLDPVKPHKCQNLNRSNTRVQNPSTLTSTGRVHCVTPPQRVASVTNLDPKRMSPPALLNAKSSPDMPPALCPATKTSSLRPTQQGRPELGLGLLGFLARNPNSKPETRVSKQLSPRFLHKKTPPAAPCSEFQDYLTSL